MRINTYNKLEIMMKYKHGYISTSELMKEGFTNRQIAVLTEEDYIQKICHGYYWLNAAEIKKPEDYKCIEACLSNSKAVICTKSACYIQGILKGEPEELTVATARSDRSSMKLNFPIKRHYFSESNFWFGVQKKETEFGCYNIYDIERSICDMIRLGEIEIEVLDQLQIKRTQYERIKKYAELLSMRKKIKDI